MGEHKDVIDGRNVYKIDVYKGTKEISPQKWLDENYKIIDFIDELKLIDVDHSLEVIDTKRIAIPILMIKTKLSREDMEKLVKKYKFFYLEGRDCYGKTL